MTEWYENQKLKVQIYNSYFFVLMQYLDEKFN